MTAGEVTPELVMELLRPSQVALSPDGSRIAFGVSASFREQGKLIESRLWTGEVDGSLRPGEAGTLPRFSPDGSRLASRPTGGTRGAGRTWWTTASSARSRAPSRTCWYGRSRRAVRREPRGRLSSHRPSSHSTV
jgi:hypothetical protein